MQTVSYLLPAHNEENTIPDTLRALVTRLAQLPGSEAIVIENGSSDQTAEVAKKLGEELKIPEVAIRVEVSRKGYGNALRKGIEVATSEYLMLTAADLPFGFSDLDAALALDSLPAITIGSKAHRDSHVQVSTVRRTMSATFRILRRVLLGVDVGDSQGTILIERKFAQSLLPELQSEGFFLSTELIALASARGASIGEIPVDYSNPRPDSTVKPVSDSIDVLREMFALRRRIKQSAFQTRS
ncbi:MAG: glycosyltransferase [Actinomycetota bacterium]|nr:glycosyltransferase [Actinomycetota bacterium]